MNYIMFIGMIVASIVVAANNNVTPLVWAGMTFFSCFGAMCLVLGD